ncbi:MAG: HAD family hydrolase [Lachnospiraceae bacterium]|nr:HAD family hydrolase [Lachnospiraceae bacterium]
MIKYILLDLDGTLTDPGQGITNSVAYSLKKFGIDVESRESLYKFIGPPIRDSYMSFCGFDAEKAELAVKYYREYFSDIGIFENTVYDGVIPMLAKLQNCGFKLILATSKPEVFAERILQHFGLSDFFTVVAGSLLDGKRNAKAEVIEYALSLANVSSKDECVMVGDRDYDIVGAKKNSIKSIGVLYGYGSEQELSKAGADLIAANVKELTEILLKGDI